MDLSKVFRRQLWLKNPLRLILAWVLFMLHTNIPSAQTIHRRIYALYPSQDTFLQGPARPYFQVDFLEVGVRENGLSSGQESRTLIRFDIEKFKEDSHWGKEDNFNHLNKTILTSATLTLYCLSVSDSSGIGGDIYSDKINLARVLKSWEEEKVTETERNTAGDRWAEPNLATDGRDATEPLQNLVVLVDKQTCSAGESFTFNLTGIFSDWLEGKTENYGLLLWAENVEDTRMVLRLASVDSGIVERHPVIEVQLQDTIYKSHECPTGELQCIDGNCIPHDKICNFVDDCLHGTDEEQCGTICDFESTCNWTTPETSDGLLGWQINRGNTSTPDTGPPGGYTDVGFDESGQYMYVEASGKPNKTSSYLVSPMYAESGPQCRLHFQYHMYGAKMGSLALILKYQGQEKVIWKEEGDQGDRWLGDVILLGRLPNPFQLMFQAIRGGGELSDVALDDIKLLDCSPDLPTPICGPTKFQCTNQACISSDLVCDLREDCLLGNDEDAAMCGVVPVGGACSFEDGWCEWFDIVEGDQYNWTRHQGATPTGATGPSVDHTLGTSEGYYMFVETSNPIGNYHEAHIRSRWFDPPPPENYNKTSEYYQTCKVRFAYHMYGINTAPLKLYLIQNVTESASQLFSESSQDHDQWYTDSTVLPVVEQSYYLQFEGGKTRGYKGDVAIDDVSLSPQCFYIPATISSTPENELSTQLAETTLSVTTDYTTEEPMLPVGNGTEFYFSSCGAYGAIGPNQQQCAYSYRYEDLVVTVLEGDMAGVQVWVVPETGPYSILAKGASGGAGVENPGPSHGAVVEATFNLSQGDHLYILVGQEGEKACDSDGLHIDDVCRGQLEDDLREEYDTGGKYAGGGGGGGGATFIAQKDPFTGRLMPLLVAAGGGGLSFGRTPPENQSLTDGKIDDPGPGLSGIHADDIDVSGAGGGWNGSSTLLATGKSFLQGGVGGPACYKALSELLWNTHGGFGGGGGACTTGGGGGGYSGGNAPLIKRLEGNGEGGTSFVHNSGIYIHRESGGHSGPGQVAIIASVICSDGWRLDEDRQSCLAPIKLPVVKVPVAAIVGSVIPVFILVILIIAVLLLVYFRKSKQLKDAEQRMNTADFRLTELRQTANVDFNPCYSLGEGTSIKVADLKEVPRDNLTLTSALGQGAFGEVYHGLFKPPEEKEEMQVAVKTLQETATETDEQDFLMEALIMGNFDHPNIVTLIGVCFTQHPRFILLEYMAGGELKVFLRESRPHDGEPSPLQITDLLQIALDVSRGCEYLESRHFIHRDIAARNVLLSCKEKGRTAKIGDFGMARDIYRSDYYKKGGQALLPVKWMPPEAFMDGIFTVKTDIWAFGVLLWEIMSLGFMPYPGMSNHEVIQFVTKGERMNPPRYCPTPVHNMMTRCWRQVPDDRPTFSGLRSNLMQCLQDPDIVKTPLPLKMTEMDTSRPSIIRPRNPETAPVLKVENPSSSVRVSSNYQDNTIFPTNQPSPPIDVSDNTWVGRNGIALELLAADHYDINANKKRRVDPKPQGLKVKIPPPPANESTRPRRDSAASTPRRDSAASTPRRDSAPKTPSQFANPSYAYSSPTPDKTPKNPFSSTVNDHDSAGEKSDLISRDDDEGVADLAKNELVRSSKQKSGSKKSGLKALLRQTSKDTVSSGSRSNTPSPSPTSLTFSRQGSAEKTLQGKDDTDHAKTNGLSVANGNVGKEKCLSPARVLRYNTTDGCILFEEQEDGEVV